MQTFHISKQWENNEWVERCYILGILCVGCFFIDLIFVTGTGEYWVGLFDSFGGTTGLIFVGLFEVIFVSYVYGWRR